VTQEEKALVIYRIERSRETFDEARLLFDAGYLNTCVNRLYYACFYAVSALLMTRKISTSKHQHLRSLLHRDYVKEGLVPIDFGKHFDILFDSRQEGDYVDFVTFRAEEIEPWFERTKQFIEYIDQLIQNAINQPG